jgi:hypothetical protein
MSPSIAFYTRVSLSFAYMLYAIILALGDDIISILLTAGFCLANLYKKELLPASIIWHQVNLVSASLLWFAP